MISEFKVSYDSQNDILYIAKEGIENEFLEIAPGINIEIDNDGQIIGFEIFKASDVLKNVVPSLNDKLFKAS